MQSLKRQSINESQCFARGIDSQVPHREREFTVDNGYLTPSMKLKRASVTRDFAHEIEALQRQRSFAA